MNKLSKTAGAGLAALLLASCSGGLVSDQSTLTLSAYANPGNADADVAAFWANEVAEKTDGEIEFNEHYSASLLAADDHLQGIGDGRADVGIVFSAYYENQLPLTSITAVPFQATNTRAAIHALNALTEESDELLEEYHRAGVHPVFFFPMGDPTLVSRDSIISGTEDLQGRQTRAVGATNVALDIIGANPVPLPFNETYEALDRGLIDSASGVFLESMEAGSFSEVAPYLANPKQGLQGVYVMAMKLDVWEGLSSEAQELMKEEGESALETYFELRLQGDALGCDAIEAAGGSVMVWDESETQKWADETGDSLLEQWRTDVGDGSEVFEKQYLDTLAAFEQEVEPPMDGVEQCAARL